MLVRKIGVLSLAINSAVIGALVGLIGAVFFLLFGSAFFAAMQTVATQAGQAGGEAPSAALGAGMGLVGLVLFPLLYAVSGFIGGAIWALVFNLAAKLTGGLQIETT